MEIPFHRPCITDEEITAITEVLMTAKKAMCGKDCHQCATFLATRSDDVSLRETIAQSFAKDLGIRIDPEEVSCLGCWSEESERIRFSRHCSFRKAYLSQQAVASLCIPRR